MKRWIVVAICIAGIWGIAFCIKAIVLRQESASSINPRTETHSDEHLGVDELMKNVDSIRGTVQVRGVVSSILLQKQMFTLIDIEEYKKCGILTCAPLILPIQWEEPMPAVRELVEVKGKVQEANGKLVFDATQISMVEMQGEGVE